MGAYQTIMVGTDGSDSSLRAVEKAASLAGDAAAKLIVVCAYHAASEREVASAGDALGDEAYQVVGSAPAEATLRTAAGGPPRRAPPTWSPARSSGDPVKTLVAASRTTRWTCSWWATVA